MAKRQEVTSYSKLSAKERLNYIYRNYGNYENVISGCRDGIIFWISSEKAYNHRARMGEIGVRIQNSGVFSDPTATKAIENIMIEDSINTCNMSEEFFEDIEDKETIIEKVWDLQLMNMEYQCLCQQLLSFSQREITLFNTIMKKQKSYSEVAEDLCLETRTVQQAVYLIKKRLTERMLSCMSDYSKRRSS